MRARLAGGSTLVEAFLDGIREAPPELASMSPRFEETVRYGHGFAAALDDVRADLADPIADRITMTLAVANAAGGRKVGEVLAALSASVADELRLRRAHHAAMTEQRMTAAVALVAPWALLGLTLATNPQATSAYRSATGTLVVGIGLVGTGLGYVLAARSARLAEAPRVFE
jgi:tight adherence protein B